MADGTIGHVTLVQENGTVAYEAIESAVSYVLGKARVAFKGTPADCSDTKGVYVCIMGRARGTLYRILRFGPLPSETWEDTLEEDAYLNCIEQAKALAKRLPAPELGVNPLEMRKNAAAFNGSIIAVKGLPSAEANEAVLLGIIHLLLEDSMMDHIGIEEMASEGNLFVGMLLSKLNHDEWW